MIYSPKIHKKGHRFVIDTYNSGKKNGWWQMVAKVRARDQGKCVYCGAPATEVHHLIPLSKGGTTSVSNLACVCRSCHEKKHPYNLYSKRRI